MQHHIIRYQVQNPLLRRYIRFFWELRIEHADLHHKIIPQRNINMRLNLCNTPHYICSGSIERKLESVYFSGLQNQFTNAHLKLNGLVHTLGICFEPDGVYPFLKIPLSEFRNQILGVHETGIKIAENIIELLQETPEITGKLAILENELLTLLKDSCQPPQNFRLLFHDLLNEKSLGLTEFCSRNHIDMKQLERLFMKYVGLSANTYYTLNRFHESMNQLLDTEFSKLSDLAYDNEYFDQTHFIKEFKRFTGNTPKHFIRESNSLLQIGKLT